MNPIVLLLAGGGAVYGLVKTLGKKPVQIQSVVGAGGVPVKIITPVPDVVTTGQKTGVSTPPAPTKKAIAHPASGGIAYAPPKAIVVSEAGIQPAPIIATPTGASSIVISSVKDVQRALNTLGFMPPLKEDGILGPKSIANIRAFQSKNHLVVDGNAGPATKAALSTALSHLAAGDRGVINADVTPPGHRDQYNDNWAAPKGLPTTAENKAGGTMSVRDIQRNLNLLGASPKLKEDGVPGPMTVAAIKSFQVGHGLAADGVAGPATKAMIYQLAHAPVKQFSGDFVGGCFG